MQVFDKTKYHITVDTYSSADDREIITLFVRCRHPNSKPLIDPITGNKTRTFYIIKLDDDSWIPLPYLKQHHLRKEYLHNKQPPASVAEINIDKLGY